MSSVLRILFLGMRICVEKIRKRELRDLVRKSYGDVDLVVSFLHTCSVPDFGIDRAKFINFVVEIAE
jgi:hypothetical protein